MQAGYPLWLCHAAVLCVWAAERAGDTTALPSQGTDTIFRGSHARYVVTVEAAGARCAVPADFDGDGDMDIVSVSSSDNTVAWYERLDDGAYGPKQMISRASNGARIVTTGDIDQDGKVDVVVASYYDHTVGWFKNLGGQFGPMNVVTRSAFSAQGVSLADLDNDGDLDILSASSGDSTVAWYENLGGGVFCEVKNIVDYMSMGVRTVMAADLDKDGDMDMASASKDDNRVTWYRNDGSMNFEKIVIDGSAGGSYSLVISDVDRDGNLDIVGAANAEGKDVSGEGEGGKINFYRGDGRGNFTKVPVTGQNDYDWFALSVWSGDLDGDGDDDIASASFALLHEGSISWYENIDGQGNTWSRHKIYITSTSKTGHYVFGADMDGDGDNDLVAVTNGDNKVQILYASTQCDISTAHPRSECCTADQLWNGSKCISCPLGEFKTSSSSDSVAVCSPCKTTCPRQGLSYLPKSCWSISGCADFAADIAKCDCGQNRFLLKDYSICQTCPNGMITLKDRQRLPSDHKMVARKLLDETTYMISDLNWHGFDSSRCEFPKCLPGRFFNMTIKECEPCVAGRYSPGGSIVECPICIPGSMCPEEASIHIPCQPGYFSVGAQAECTESPTGTHTPVSGLSNPWPCSAGEFQDTTASTSCKKCPAGSYQTNESSTACDACPQSMITKFMGAERLADCVCPRRHYLSHSTFCTRCPEIGVKCPGGGSAGASLPDGSVKIEEGYMSLAEDPLSVYICEDPQQRCPGLRSPWPSGGDGSKVVPGMCDRGFVGIACGFCPEGFSLNDNSCEPCVGVSRHKVPSFIILGLGCLLLSAMVFNGHMQPASQVDVLSHSLRMLLTASVITRINVEWPKNLTLFFSVMNLFQFELQKMDIPLDCFSGSHFLSRFALKLSWPIILIACLVTVYSSSQALHKFAHWCSGRDLISHPLDVMPKTLQRCVRYVDAKLGRFMKVPISERMSWFWPIRRVDMKSCIVSTHASLFILITNCCMTIFFTREHPNKVSTVISFPSVIYMGPHWWAAVPQAIVGLLFYSVAFFAYVSYIVYIAPRWYGDSERFRDSYGSLWDLFHPRCWWFCLLELIFGLGLNLTTAIVKRGQAQIIFLVLQTICFLVVLIEVKPYVYSTNNVCNFVCRFGIVTFMLLLILEPDDTNVPEYDTRQSIALMSCIALPLLVCLLSFFHFLWNRQVMLERHREFRAQFTDRLGNISTIIGSLPTKQLRAYALGVVDGDAHLLDRALDTMQFTLLGIQPDSRWKWRCDPKTPFDLCQPGRIEAELIARGLQREDGLFTLAWTFKECVYAHLAHADRLQPMFFHKATKSRHSEPCALSTLSQSFVMGLSQEDRNLVELLTGDDGFVTKDVFIDKMAACCADSLSSAELDKVYDYFDTDMDGKLSPYELISHLNAIRDPSLPGPMRPHLDTDHRRPGKSQMANDPNLPEVAMEPEAPLDVDAPSERASNKFSLPSSSFLVTDDMLFNIESTEDNNLPQVATEPIALSDFDAPLEQLSLEAANDSTASCERRVSTDVNESHRFTL